MTPKIQTRQHWLTMAPALGLNAPQKNTKRTTRTRINTKTKRQTKKLAQNPCPRSHYRRSKVICFLLDQLMSTSGRQTRQISTLPLQCPRIVNQPEALVLNSAPKTVHKGPIFVPQSEYDSQQINFDSTKLSIYISYLICLIR